MCCPEVCCTHAVYGARGGWGEREGPCCSGLPWCGGRASEGYHVIHLSDATSPSDETDIVTDLRNMLPGVRIFYVGSRNVISMMSTEQDYEIAKQIVTDMSRGPRVFRLTYSISGTDTAGGAKHRNVVMVVASGDRSLILQGERVPVTTGGFSTKSGAAVQDVQYLDVGLKLGVSLSGPADDLVLETHLTESAVVSEKSISGVDNPILRQTSLDNTSIVSVGKPLVLGSISIPGMNQQEQIEVTVEPVR